MIEKAFDTAFVASLAQREKQIQQSYRPIIGVHKWFARRPSAIYRALLLSEFGDADPLAASYFRSHDFKGLVVGDPFMGGGTPVLEANRLGCHVVGIDINPMAYWIVKQELAEVDLKALRDTAKDVIGRVQTQLGQHYETKCLLCGRQVPVKYFLWVKQLTCEKCHGVFDLFPNYLLAKNQRHPNHVLICHTCGTLNEVASLRLNLDRCRQCGDLLKVESPVGRNRALCPHCGHENTYPQRSQQPPRHRLFAIEYHCEHCAPSHQGRFFKAPDEQDQALYESADRRLAQSTQAWIPDEAIPPGDETKRLHRWGYTSYRQLFNARQLLGLNTLADEISRVDDPSIRQALLTVFSDTLRYQNMLCRYDSYALKILDIFSVHGFPVGLVQCENSVLGIPGVGSGAYRHFVEKYYQAKEYGSRPFEKSLETKRKVYISGETIAAQFTDRFPEGDEVKKAFLAAVPSDEVALPAASLDAVLTDPPYFGNVQYAELMDFCYVWLRKHLDTTEPAFRPHSTRAEGELTVNDTEERGIEHFTAGMSRVFRNFARALKRGAPFAFTYHHNEPYAYFPIVVSLLDAQLTCTATIPCPAEMGASIHINGTKSSVVDTVFVCRSTGTVRARDFETSTEALKRMLIHDVETLLRAGHEATLGDARCMLMGHIGRLVIWQLRSQWQPSLETYSKLDIVRSMWNTTHPLDQLDALATEALETPAMAPLFAHTLRESRQSYDDEVSF